MRAGGASLPGVGLKKRLIRLRLGRGFVVAFSGCGGRIIRLKLQRLTATKIYTPFCTWLLGEPIRPALFRIVAARVEVGLAHRVWCCLYRDERSIIFQASASEGCMSLTIFMLGPAVPHRNLPSRDKHSISP